VTSSNKRAVRRGHYLVSTAAGALGIAFAAVMTTSMPVPARAQQVAANALDFKIDPQSLSSALRALATQSGLHLGYTTADIAGLQSKGAQGRLTPHQALQKLLEGTGIAFSVTGPNTVALRPVNAQSTGADGVTLDTINVTGETAWGPVDGYVATRSGVGTKSDASILETPQSVSVVTSDQMRDRGVSTVVEALQYVPGVNTHNGGKDPRYDYITIRGFSTYGNGSYRDGLREIDDANSLLATRTETYGLERIDVVRGPSSVLYGQTGPGGVIDKISKRPTDKPFYEIGGLTGNYNRYQATFDLGGPLDKDKTLLYRLTGLFRDSDSQIAHFSNDVKDDRKYIAPAFTWQPNSDTKLTFLGEYQKDLTGNAFPLSRVRIVGTTMTSVEAVPIFLGDPNWNKFDQEQYRVGYEFEHRFNDAVTVKQKLRYSKVEVDYRFLTGYLVNNGTTAARTANWGVASTDGVSTDNQLHAKLHTGPFDHSVLVGLDYQKTQFDQVYKYDNSVSLNSTNPVYYQSITAPTTVRTSAKQDLSQLGLYAQDQIKLQNWLLTLGGRQDWASLDSDDRVANTTTSVDDKAFTKRLGLTYLAPSGLAPYVSYAESFMPQTGTSFAGTPFKPTKGKQWEGGVKYQPPGSRTLLTLAVFDIKQQNVLTTDPDHTNFNVQTGEVRSRGIEAQASTSPVEGLELIASYTQMKVEVTQSTKADLGKVPVVTPERLASLWADYTFKTGRLEGLGFGGGVRYNGKNYMDIANTLVNDPYTVFDAAVHLDWKGARFAINVNNVFNREQTLCTTTGGCQYISPRVVTASARYRW